jgi:integrase
MAVEKINFTKAALDALPVPAPGKRIYHWDSKTRGLAICVTGTGSKTFYVYRKIGGKPQQYRIGPYPDLSIEQARRKADEYNGLVAVGEDPKDRQREAKKDPTFEQVFEWYMEVHAKPRKESWREDQAQFNRYLQGLAGVKVAKISMADIRNLHTRVGKEHGPYAANRLLSLVRGVFNKAIKGQFIKSVNPALGIDKFVEVSRARRLEAEEIPLFFQAVEEDPNADIRDYIMLSLYTGARKTNVLEMRWDQIDFTTATWQIPMTKNKTPQTVTLDKPELEILKRRKANGSGLWVFPGSGKTGHMVEPKGGWRRILDRAGIRDLRIHDLRRTLGSWMGDEGASMPIVGRALNHKSQATTQVYLRLSNNPVRQAKTKAIEALQRAAMAGSHADNGSQA